jgi:hypothetical protein
MVPKFQVATAFFSCSPPDLNSSKLRSLAVRITKIIYVNTNFEINAPRPLSQATVSTGMSWSVVRFVEQPVCSSQIL